MRLVPEIGWRRAGQDGVRLDARLLPLLREIARRATLRAAAAHLGISYRSAWDMLLAQCEAAGGSLVTLEQGRGAKLTPLAERLLAADEAARSQLLRLEPGLAVVLAAGERGAGGRALRVAASHDPLLAAFVDEPATRAELALELQFKGSADSLADYTAGRADLAGFHIPLRDAGAADDDPLLARLSARRDRLIRFAEREQGLMLAPGNPKRIRGLADLARKKLQFVNRQRGSGTRLLFDELLAQQGIDATAIDGYRDEEFTHLAVAVSVAAGRADAGFGVHAAAARFGLEFLPLQRERYWFAVRARNVGDAPLERFRAGLAGRAFKRIARGFVGYDVSGAGEVCALGARGGA
ncbi:MAG: substrate-binding domain-containing protein [Burkholderiales bacterium]